MTLQTFSLISSTKQFLQNVIKESKSFLPTEVCQEIKNIDLVGQDSLLPLIPCPYKETEAITSLKIIEAAYALTLLNMYERSSKINERASVNINHSTAFLFLAFQSTIDGISKLQPEHYFRLLDTDVHQSQSNVYRLAVTNIFKTLDGYFQFHGGLNASITLKYLGLDERRPDLLDYEECCALIEEQTSKFTNSELTKLCKNSRQAGSPVLSREEYLQSEQGLIESKQDWLQCDQIERDSPCVPLSGKYILSNIRVLDLTRVIAGPLIGRTLAEYGADVLRIHNIALPDVPYYQVDLNYGKHATHIDLKSEEGKAAFNKLLQEADVIIDGYRPGVLDRLGFGPNSIKEKLKTREKGFVYLSENCHGWIGPLTGESGWQQIADASCGMSKAQGEFWKRDEPIAPPFPMADFGTGEMGTIAILHGLYLRASKGGSYHVKVSLCGFNNFVMNAGQYDSHIQELMYVKFKKDFNENKIHHSSNFNKVGKAALTTMRKVSPQLWSSDFMTKSKSQCFGSQKGIGAIIQTQSGVVQCSAKNSNFFRSTRFNGFDEANWKSFESDIFNKET